MVRATQWRLERKESLDLFLLWRSMGGQPPTLGELLQMPSWIVRDFSKLNERLQKAKARKKNRGEAANVPTYPRRIIRPRSR
jgi:hypothetical protein